MIIYRKLYHFWEGFLESGEGEEFRGLRWRREGKGSSDRLMADCFGVEKSVVLRKRRGEHPRNTGAPSPGFESRLWGGIEGERSPL